MTSRAIPVIYKMTVGPIVTCCLGHGGVSEAGEQTSDYDRIQLLNFLRIRQKWSAPSPDKAIRERRAKLQNSFPIARSEFSFTGDMGATQKIADMRRCDPLACSRYIPSILTSKLALVIPGCPLNDARNGRLREVPTIRVDEAH
jgi:hypothetical protein